MRRLDDAFHSKATINALPFVAGEGYEQSWVRIKAAIARGEGGVQDPKIANFPRMYVGP